MLHSCIVTELHNGTMVDAPLSAALDQPVQTCSSRCKDKQIHEFPWIGILPFVSVQH